MQKRPAKTFSEGKNESYILGSETSKFLLCGTDLEMIAGKVRISTQTHNITVPIVAPDKDKTLPTAKAIREVLIREYPETQCRHSADDDITIISGKSRDPETNEVKVEYVVDEVIMPFYSQLRLDQKKSTSPSDACFAKETADSREKSRRKRANARAGIEEPPEEKKVHRTQSFESYQISVTVRIDHLDRSIDPTWDNYGDLAFANARIFMSEPSRSLKIGIVGIRSREAADHVFRSVISYINYLAPCGLQLSDAYEPKCSLQACRFPFFIPDTPPGTDIFDLTSIRTLLSFFVDNADSVIERAKLLKLDPSQYDLEKNLIVNSISGRSGVCLSYSRDGNPLYKFEMFSTGIVAVTGNHSDEKILEAQSIIMAFVKKYGLYFVNFDNKQPAISITVNDCLIGMEIEDVLPTPLDPLEGEQYGL